MNEKMISPVIIKREVVLYDKFENIGLWPVIIDVVLCLNHNPLSMYLN